MYILGLAGRGDQVALIWDSPVSKNLHKYTYKDLHQQVPTPCSPPRRSGVDCRLVCLAHPHHTHKVTHFAGVLANTHGVEKGDRVLIYMPMIPQGNPAAPRSCALSRRGKP